MAPKKAKVKKEDVFKLCLCLSCPSWVSCGEEGGFCLAEVGKSKCIEEERGCVCRACQVTKLLMLKSGYYCTRGSEKEQSKK